MFALSLHFKFTEVLNMGYGRIERNNDCNNGLMCRHWFSNRIFLVGRNFLLNLAIISVIPHSLFLEILRTPLHCPNNRILVGY